MVRIIDYRMFDPITQHSLFDVLGALFRFELGRMHTDHDEFIRGNTTMEGLAKLKPVFKPIGAAGMETVVKLKYPNVEAINYVHTAGNSSGIVDGSALVLMGNEKIGKELGLTPRARVVSTAVG